MPYPAHLFGSNPPATIDVERASRIVADATLVGDIAAAAFHGTSPASIRRLNTLRSVSLRLDSAVRNELCRTPDRLNTSARVKAWAFRPLGATVVDLVEDGVSTTLAEFGLPTDTR